MKTLILFDIGAVQLEIHYDRFFREVPKLSSLSLEKFKEKYGEAELRFNMGEMNTVQFLSAVKAIMDKKSMTDKNLKELLVSLWKPEIKDVIKVKRKLIEAGHIVGNFSNISEFAFEVISKKYPEIFESDKSFPGIYSSRIGSVKPNDNMYKAVRGFERVIYIDDNDAYVRKGLEFGWEGIVFAPFIDKSEAIRSTQHYKKSAKAMKTVSSVKELEKTLRSLCVEF